jgi:hypothetical protein
VRGQRGAGVAEPGDGVDHAVGQARLLQQLTEAQCRQRVCSAGLSTTVQPHRNPSQPPSGHQHREVHGMIWPTAPTGSRNVYPNPCFGGCTWGSI